MLWLLLVDVTRYLFTLGVKLGGPVEVAQHPSGTLGEHQCVGVGWIDTEDVRGVFRGVVRPAGVEEHTREVNPQREVVGRRGYGVLQRLYGARR